MALGEFALIERFFASLGASRDDVRLGIGDDGAVLRPAPGLDLVAVSDTLVEGVHFPVGSPAESIGHRALAVNLSDIAAMGATPAWALLALTMPQADAGWLAGFARGFGTLARRHDVALVGGDTTRGPLMVSVQVLGTVPPGAPLQRAGARAGDEIWVSGSPGEASAGLDRLLTPTAAATAVTSTATTTAAIAASLAAAQESLCRRFLYPTPRVSLGVRLRGIASACIDISDGLAGDLAKLAAASGVRAELDAARLPVSPELLRVCGPMAARERLLGGGDDYELLFTVPASRRDALESIRASLDAADRPVLTAIGTVHAADARQVGRVELIEAGQAVVLGATGFDHFA